MAELQIFVHVAYCHGLFLFWRCCSVLCTYGAIFL